MADPSAIQQQLGALNPEFAAAPPDFQTRFVQAVTTGTPQQRANALASLQREYPQYIRNESLWKNKAFLAGVAALGGGLLYGALAPAAATGITTGPTLAQAGGSALAGGAGATGIAGPIAGTATTGGAAGGILGALSRYAGPIGDIGSALTNAAAYDAQGRRADAANNARAIAENNAAKVQAAQFNLGLPSVRTNQVARGEVLNTMKDAPLTGDPRIDKFAGGGLIPSAFGPQSRAAGAELSRQAMSGLMNPAQDRLTPQEIPPYQPSTLDNVLGGVGLGADIFSLLSKYGSNPNGTR